MTFLLLSVGLSHAQPHYFTVKPSEPIRYEKKDGRLQVRSYLTSGSASASIKRMEIDGSPCELTTSGDSVIFWLPLIGDQLLLAWFDGKGKVVSQQVYQPLIPKDWGHFQHGTIHIIQSSHQDIAWMNTPEYCRHERIEDIIIPALDMMKEDSLFTFEMEQTLNLMEFLDAYPERKNEVIQRYKEGRFIWGATYNQPYEGLHSGEQLVRQIYYGRKWIRENLPGCDDFTANNIDVPGRSLQIPQIFAKSGIKYFHISRMEEGLYDWYSPDGSKLFTYSPGNYGWATLHWKFFDDGAVNAFNRLHHRSVLWSDHYRENNIPPHYAVLMSCDATKPINFTPVINEWNKIVELAEIPLPKLKASTSEAYFDEVNKAGATFEAIHGERPNLWLYIHGPAHYQAIWNKRQAAKLLPGAEAFTTFQLLGNQSLATYPTRSFDRAWMASIYPDHGWGGKNGAITDSIFTDSLRVSRELAGEMLNNALQGIADQVDAKRNDLVVFNDLTWERNDIAYFEIDSSVGAQSVVKDDRGQNVPSQLTTRGGKQVLAFQADRVPSMGYRTFTLGKGKPVQQPPASVTVYNNYYENEYYRVVLGNGGITSLYDKQLGKEVLETSKFAGGDVLEAGYTGHGAGEFVRVKELTPGDLSTVSALPAQWVIKQSGRLFTEYENRQATKNAHIVQTIRLFHTLKRIDVDVALVDFNGTHNRQYRVAFPLKMRNQQIAYEVPMAVLEVGKDEMKRIPKGWGWEGTYTDRPEDTHPREIQRFISANGEGFGFTLSSGVAVADYVDPSREQANYPVIQGILLSSHKSCHGEGNWYEQDGTHHYSFSITSHNEGWEHGYHFGIDANHPLRVVAKQSNRGDLERAGSFLTISDPYVQLNILKKADNDDEVIIRLTEMRGRDTQATITLPRPVKKVTRTNMVEEDIEQSEIVGATGTTFTLPIPSRSIETFKLHF